MLVGPLITISWYATAKTITLVPILPTQAPRVASPAPSGATLVVNDHHEYYLFIKCELCVLKN